MSNKTTITVTWNGPACEVGCTHDFCYFAEMIVGSLMDLGGEDDPIVLDVDVKEFDEVELTDAAE